MTNLYKKYFYGEHGENDTNNHVIGDGNHHKLDTSINSTKGFAKNISKSNVSTEQIGYNFVNTSNNSKVSKNFSFQIIEDIMLGKRNLFRYSFVKY